MGTPKAPAPQKTELPPLPRPRSLSAGRRLLFALVPLVLLLVVGEIAARRAPPRLLDTRSIRVKAAVQAGTLVASFEVPGWDIQVGEGNIDGSPYHVNRWNMRGPDYDEQKPDGAERIILVGDSTPFGVQLAWDETFLARFAALRSAAYPNKQLEVAACACPGHSTWQSKFKLPGQCLAFQPDYVIIANQNSDSALDVAEDKNAFPAPHAPALRRLLSELALYRLAAAWVMPTPPPPRTIAQVGEGPLGEIVRVNDADYKANLEEMVEDVREAGAIPIFLVLPSRQDTRPNSDLPNDMRGRKQMLRVFAQAWGVTLIDGQSWFEASYPGQDLFIDSVHPNAEGAMRLGQAIHAQFPR